MEKTFSLFATGVIIAVVVVVIEVAKQDSSAQIARHLAEISSQLDSIESKLSR